jgi:hypothetical protein
MRSEFVRDGKQSDLILKVIQEVHQDTFESHQFGDSHEVSKQTLENELERSGRYGQSLELLYTLRYHGWMAPEGVLHRLWQVMTRHKLVFSKTDENMKQEPIDKSTWFAITISM